MIAAGAAARGLDDWGRDAHGCKEGIYDALERQCNEAGDRVQDCVESRVRHFCAAKI